MNHIDLGRLGERKARDFLEQKGYGILDLNWKPRREEIDIIACDKNVVVFVEVKTRRREIFGFPEMNVTSSKKQKYYNAAADFLDLIDHEDEIRFDVISITMEPKQKIVHFEDAFFPNWGIEREI